MISDNLTEFEQQCAKQGLHLYAKIFIDADGSCILVAVSGHANNRERVAQLITKAVIAAQTEASDANSKAN
jgi:hypothetical protein